MTLHTLLGMPSELEVDKVVREWPFRPALAPQHLHVAERALCNGALSCLHRFYRSRVQPAPLAVGDACGPLHLLPSPRGAGVGHSLSSVSV